MTVTRTPGWRTPTKRGAVGIEPTIIQSRDGRVELITPVPYAGPIPTTAAAALTIARAHLTRKAS